MKRRNFKNTIIISVLPDAWQQGTMKGLKARGGFEVNIKWKEHQLLNATIKSLNGNTCIVRTVLPVRIKKVTVKIVPDHGSYLTSFKTVKNKVYNVESP